MLKQLQEIKEYDTIMFIPHPEDETLTNINVATYKKLGEKVGGTALGDFYVIIHGKENFERKILHLCLTKGTAGYLEAKEQFVNGVLESDDYYNTWIMVRVRDSHIKGL